MNGVRLQVTTCIVTQSYMYMTSAVDRHFMPDLCTYDHIMKFVMKSMKGAYGEVIMRVKIWRGWTCLSSDNCKNTRNQMCADCRSTTQFPRLSAFYSKPVTKYCLYSWDNLGKTSLIVGLLLIILIVVLINLLVFSFFFFFAICVSATSAEVALQWVTTTASSRFCGISTKRIGRKNILISVCKITQLCCTVQQTVEGKIKS